MEQIFIILPLLLFTIPGKTAFAIIKGAIRSTSITELNSSTLISVIGILFMIPALFIKISISPIFFSISATIFFTSSSSVTSHT